MDKKSAKKAAEIMVGGLLFHFKVSDGHPAMTEAGFSAEESAKVMDSIRQIGVKMLCRHGLEGPVSKEAVLSIVRTEGKKPKGLTGKKRLSKKVAEHEKKKEEYA